MSINLFLFQIYIFLIIIGNISIYLYLGYKNLLLLNKLKILTNFTLKSRLYFLQILILYYYPFNNIFNLNIAFFIIFFSLLFQQILRILLKELFIYKKFVHFSFKYDKNDLILFGSNNIHYRYILIDILCQLLVIKLILMDNFWNSFIYFIIQDYIDNFNYISKANHNLGFFQLILEIIIKYNYEKNK